MPVDVWKQSIVAFSRCGGFRKGTSKSETKENLTRSRREMASSATASFTDKVYFDRRDRIVSNSKNKSADGILPRVRWLAKLAPRQDWRSGLGFSNNIFYDAVDQEGLRTERSRSL